MRVTLGTFVWFLAPLTPTLAFPTAIDYPVPCNASNVCGHGDCRNHTCLCDHGYSTVHVEEPCAAYGRSQLTTALLSWFLGWAGGGAWYLGWYDFAIAIVALAILSAAWLSAVITSEDDDEKGVPKTCCLMCNFCAYVALVLAVSIQGTFYCVSCMSHFACMHGTGVKCAEW